MAMLQAKEFQDFFFLSLGQMVIDSDRFKSAIKSSQGRVPPLLNPRAVDADDQRFGLSSWNWFHSLPCQRIKVELEQCLAHEYSRKIHFDRFRPGFHFIRLS